VGLDKENLLWLPFNYKPNYVAIHESIISLKHKSGRVSIIKFAF